MSIMVSALRPKKIPSAYHFHEEDLSEFLKNHSPIVYRNSFCLVYKGHVPRAGYILLNGEIFYQIKKKSFYKIDQKGHFLGFRELYQNQVSQWMIFVSSGTQLVMLDRSDLKEVLGIQDSKITNLVKNIVTTEDKHSVFPLLNNLEKKIVFTQSPSFCEWSCS
jgi:hypothetical protein